MNAPKMGSDWKPTAGGILLPPDAPRPNVVRTDFEVKVRGFASFELTAAYGPAANDAKQEFKIRDKYDVKLRGHE